MRRMLKRRVLQGLIALIGLGLLTSSLVAKPKLDGDHIHPFLRIPEMKQAPTFDGKLSPEEWQGAAIFTGVSGSPLTTPFMLPECQQVVWYLGYHKNKLYIGMQSPHPKGTFPKGKIKEPDNPDVLFEDHIEIQLCKFKPLDASRPGKGFWKMVINPWGAMHDLHYYNGTPGSEDLWSTGGNIKCHVTDSMWQMELAVTAKNMGWKKLDGRKLIIQLVRASDTGGIYFAGWVGTNWMGWAEFAECDFDPKAPTIQFDKLGEIMAGKIDTTFTLIGNADQKIPVEIEVLVENADGKIIYKDTKNATVGKGQKTELSFEKSGIPVSEVALESKKRNYFQINAIYKDGKKKVPLYFNRSPFMKLTPAWKRKYLDPWVASRQVAGEWEVVFANWVYSGKAVAKVDTEFFGVDKKILNAKSFGIEVKSKETGKIVGKGKGEIKNHRSSILFDLPELKKGEYEAVFKLYDADENEVGKKAVHFVRDQFPFEKNKLGISDEVIPPFWPLEADAGIIRGGNGRMWSGLPRDTKDVVKAWGRIYQFSGSGLLKQILVSPPTGACGGIEALFAAPIRMEIKSGGKNLSVKEAAAPKIEVKPHRADITGSATSEAMDIKVKAFEEYDGWYEVEMDLMPKVKSIDSFDIVLLMRDEKGARRKSRFPIDTLIAQRLGMGSDSFFGAIPQKPGVHFKSTSLSGRFERAGPADIPKDWKSFVPVTYIGNGDRGLYFFAWSDIGWKMQDDDSVVTVKRLKDGNVELRIRILSGLKNFTEPRKVRFAMQASPIKANNPEYRSFVDTVLHDTSGYRYYGKSVDGYCLDKDEDYDTLRKFILYKARWKPRIRNLDFTRMVLYGSQWMTGCGSEEFKTYGGEWLGNNNWKPDPDLKFADRWNMEHTYQWKTPEQLSPRRVNWSRSMLDFFIWYYYKHLSKSGFNGTWWDNCYSGLITEYDPEIGKLDSKWNFYFRRQLCKRLNVIGWQLMRRPCWIMGTPEMELSWNQIHWMVEGFWYSPTKNLSIWQNYDIGFMRSQIRPKGSVMVSKAWLHGYSGTTPAEDERVKRSAIAVLLLHDVPPPDGVKYAGLDEILHRLRYVVDYDNTTDCRFMSYNASEMFVKPVAKGILAAFYQNQKRQSAVIVFANTTKKDVALGGTSFSPAGVIDNPKGEPAAIERPLDVKKVYDLETGESVKTTYRNGMLVIDEPMVVKRDSFRLLSLEVKLSY